MVKDTYKGVPEFIKDSMEYFLDPENYYDKTHERRYARTLQVIIDQNPEGKMLELGTSKIIPMCLKTLAPELEVTVTNFDMSLPETSQLEITLRDTTEVFTSYALDLEKTPLPVDDETFDYVLCSEVIEHMEIDPMYMLSEVNRVLKPNGMLILTTPNIVSSHGLTKMMYGVEPYFFMQYHKSREYNRHNYEYSVHTLAQVLKAAGFEGSLWTEDTFEEPLPTVPERLKKAGFDINHTGDNIFAISKKVGPVVDRHPKGIYV